MRSFLQKRAATGCALLLALALPASAVAQLGGNVDFGTGSAAWDQTDGRDQLLNGAFGAGYRFADFLGLQPALTGDLALSSRPAKEAALGWNIGARFDTKGSEGGVWLGAAIGAAGSGGRHTGLTRLEGGIRRLLGPGRIDVWLSRTGFGSKIATGGRLTQDSAGFTDTLVRKGVTDFTELGSRAVFRLSSYELGFSFTQRMGNAAVRRTGWELSATWWMKPSLGIVGSTGHSLPQFNFAVPSARYGTLGLRLALGAKSQTARARPEDERIATNRPMLSVADRRLAVRWASARTAEVMGDFTDWKPLALVPVSGERWTFPVALRPGVHHLNVRFDGGAWLVPSGAFAVDDGFGGRVGLIVVR
jgi:hypothetical protein